MKDKRTKCCTNETCEHNLNRKKHRYSAMDKYCTSCGTELAFACVKCLGPLSDGGPEHKLCGNCEAEVADRNEKIKNTGGKVVAGAGALATVAFNAVKILKK